MSAPAFTPGPWTATNVDVVDKIYLEADDTGRRFWTVTQELGEFEFRGTIASVHDAEEIEGVALIERDANARLIAAAPDLYDALAALVAPSDPMKPTETRLLYQAARAALAKARGDVA